MKEIITVNSSGVGDAFRKCFKKLYEADAPSSDPDLIKESPLVLTINNINRDNLSIIVDNNQLKHANADKELISDSPETIQKVIKHYNEELFETGRVEWLVKYLKHVPNSRRSLVDVWQDQSDSNLGKDNPCVIYFWFRLNRQSLAMHTHMRANDAFRKFMLNLEIFLALQKYLATKLSYKIGRYLHFVDSFHFYKFNQQEIDELYKNLNIY